MTSGSWLPCADDNTMAPMATSIVPHLALASAAGVVGGIGLFIRGLTAYRSANRIADTAGSTISSVAVGEARLTGIVEPAEMLLTSPLQSEPCVWYRASASEQDGDGTRIVFSEERAVGFRLRDPSGAIRVFPRGARWAVEHQLDASTGLAGDEPPGLRLREGPAITGANPDRDELVAQLLTVRDPRRTSGTSLDRLRHSGERRHYREARIEPGDVITIVGFVEPFDQLPDPSGADVTEGSGLFDAAAASDPAVAADLAEARAAGLLAASPDEAWGNAAIPGFGIGKPVRAPALDPEARPLPLADAETAERIERTFDIAPEELIAAANAEVPLVISAGTAAIAADRQQSRFVLGLIGAAVAIACAAALAIMVTGGLLF